MRVHGIDLDPRAMRQFCRRWRVRDLRIFGSILRGDFGPDSDIDFLVEFDERSEWELEDLTRMKAELEELTGRKVDLVERIAIERSANYIRRKHILSASERVNVEG